MLVLMGLVVPVLSEQICDVDTRVDCGYQGITQSVCEDRGCCWAPASENSVDPWCFRKANRVSGYKVTKQRARPNGWDFDLDLIEPANLYGPDIEQLAVTVDFESNERLRVKIVDRNNKRWEVPQYILPDPNPNDGYSPSTAGYEFSWSDNSFSFQIKRKSDGEVIFDTNTGRPLIYEDQYIEIGTKLPYDPVLYGLGDHNERLRLEYNDKYFTFWSKDIPNPPGENLYGVHPFYTELRNGNAHGVFLKNANGMDIIVSNGTMKYRTIGGVLDFWFFIGPGTEQVIQQYQQVIGKPYMPPFWVLGFHQCRWGFKTIDDPKAVVQEYRKRGIPLDTMWGDIDYMDQRRDFSWDPRNFPKDQMASFVDSLHAQDMRYVVIVDPGIPFLPEYGPYEEGRKQDVFIKNFDGSLFVGEVWPGLTVFPDFMNPKIIDYWGPLITEFLDGVKVDGLWIDMNECSNFCDGSCNTNGEAYFEGGFNPDNPPYSINNGNSKLPLNVKTLSMTAKHFGENALEYNTHSLYGTAEGIVTRKALEGYYKKRTFILSRSTFSGAGQHVSHWLGDNFSTWEFLKASIAGIIDFNLFGIPMVGADICGFNGNTTEELCARWQALGAFYPFSRNHNTFDAYDQYPYTWQTVEDVTIKTLKARYQLTPYFYTLFYNAHIQGGTVARGLFWEYPNDRMTYDIDEQFLLGSNLLVSPVLKEGETSVNAYLPSGVWYDFWTGSQIVSSGQHFLFEADLQSIPVHVRGGSIIPMKSSETTTVATRKNPFQILIALDTTDAASGSIYIDDGEDLEVGKQSVHVSFTFSGSKLTPTIIQSNYNGDNDNLNVQQVTILGLRKAPVSVTVPGSQAHLSYNANSKILVIQLKTPVPIHSLNLALKDGDYE